MRKIYVTHFQKYTENIKCLCTIKTLLNKSKRVTVSNLPLTVVKMQKIKGQALVNPGLYHSGLNPLIRNRASLLSKKSRMPHKYEFCGYRSEKRRLLFSEVDGFVAK